MNSKSIFKLVIAGLAAFLVGYVGGEVFTVATTAPGVIAPAPEGDTALAAR